MGIPNENESKGTVKQATGKVKDKVGEWTGDEDLEAEGEVEHTEGEIQDKFGEGKRKAGEAIEEAGRKLKR